MVGFVSPERHPSSDNQDRKSEYIKQRSAVKLNLACSEVQNKDSWYAVDVHPVIFTETTLKGVIAKTHMKNWYLVKPKVDQSFV